MVELSKPVFSSSQPHFTDVHPQRIHSRLGDKERQILWFLGAEKHSFHVLQEYTGQSEKQFKRSINRLKQKNLVKEEGKDFILTDRGKSALLWLATKKAVWFHHPPPIVHSQYKVVAFDLDDTLIPGYVNKKTTDFSTMRELLETLKANKIKTAVVSINSPSTVVNRLSDYGLLQYIDFPVFTNKAGGVEVIKKSMNLSDDQILVVGHDFSLDWFNIKDKYPNVRVAMIRDAISRGDSKSSKLPTGVLYVNRNMEDFLKMLQGQIDEDKDKKALITHVEKEVGHSTPTTTYTYSTLTDSEVEALFQKLKNGQPISKQIGHLSDNTLGRLRYLIEEDLPKQKEDTARIKDYEDVLHLLDSWRIETAPPHLGKQSYLDYLYDQSY